MKAAVEDEAKASASPRARAARRSFGSPSRMLGGPEPTPMKSVGSFRAAGVEKKLGSREVRTLSVCHETDLITVPVFERTYQRIWPCLLLLYRYEGAAVAS